MSPCHPQPRAPCAAPRHLLLAACVVRNRGGLRLCRYGWRRLEPDPALPQGIDYWPASGTNHPSNRRHQPGSTLPYRWRGCVASNGARIDRHCAASRYAASGHQRTLLPGITATGMQVRSGTGQQPDPGVSGSSHQPESCRHTCVSACALKRHAPRGLAARAGSSAASNLVNPVRGGGRFIITQPRWRHCTAPTSASPRSGTATCAGDPGRRGRCTCRILDYACPRAAGGFAQRDKLPEALVGPVAAGLRQPGDRPRPSRPDRAGRRRAALSLFAPQAASCADLQRRRAAALAAAASGGTTTCACIWTAARPGDRDG